MTVVKDRDKTIINADGVAIELITLLKKEMLNYFSDDDPAEQIYTALHILSNFTARLYMILDGYNQTYGIKMTIKDIREITNNMLNDYLSMGERLHSIENVKV